MGDKNRVLSRVFFTYLVAIFAFTVELPVLAHLSAELVHVGSRRSEFIVKRQVVETLFEHVALLLATSFALRILVLILVSLRHEGSCRFEEGDCVRVVLERGLLLSHILFGSFAVLLGLNTRLKLLTFLDGYRCVDIKRATSRESYRFEAVVGSGCKSREIVVALRIVRVLIG